MAAVYRDELSFPGNSASFLRKAANSGVYRLRRLPVWAPDAWGKLCGVVVDGARVMP